VITRASLVRLRAGVISESVVANYVALYVHHGVADLGRWLLATVGTSGGCAAMLATHPGRARVASGFSAIALLLAGVSVLGPSPARAAKRTAAPARSLEMTAVFAQPSYSPGQVARVRVVADATRLTVQPIAAFSRSPDAHAPIVRDPAVGRARTIAWHRGAGMLTVRIGRRASGVYFVRIRGAGEQVVAPVVVRPADLGHAPVAVVVPTYTWQAYNRRGGDTWYVCSCVHTIDLTRPYLDGGVPYNFGQDDRNFFRWLARSHFPVDVLADQDLNRIASGVELRHLYRMVVFESHGEYVTSHMFDITEQYRNVGGHLAFLSANDFFRDVLVSSDSMTLIGRFRDIGRPEAALIGAQYIDWYRNRYPSQPYRVVRADRVPWLFTRTGLKDGSLIPGHYGIEIDGTTSASPRGTTVVATIPNIFPGETADMTYYSTAAGAEVFDAGTINFGGAAANPYVARMLHNLWTHMSGATALPPNPTSGRERGHG
jgi:N,N-dimethylformamidase beta subunit-like, C-terminal